MVQISKFHRTTQNQIAGILTDTAKKHESLKGTLSTHRFVRTPDPNYFANHGLIKLLLSR